MRDPLDPQCHSGSLLCPKDKRTKERLSLMRSRARKGALKLNRGNRDE